jgi:hypothetical protein
MQKPPSTIRTRDLAFLFWGLVDFILGALLLLGWFDLLPFDLVIHGIPRWQSGLIGAVMSVLGVVVIAYQLAGFWKPKE